jgi:hypothetical protein
MSEHISIVNRKARYYYFACMAIFFYRFLSNTLFSQLGQPVLIHPGLDPMYWVMHLLGIPYAATHSLLGPALLDMLLFLMPVMAILLPDSRRIYAILFSILVLIYQFTYSTFAMHHYHGLVAVLVMSVPFWFAPAGRFERVWDGARYYLFFMFSSAALWKLGRGSELDTHQFSNILMAQYAQYLYDYPTGLFTTWVGYLIAHPSISYLFLLAGLGLQLSFIGGFITKRYDRVYLLLLFGFVIFNYVLMHILLLEILPMGLLLLDYTDTPVEA